jgi:hypothetical protein
VHAAGGTRTHRCGCPPRLSTWCLNRSATAAECSGRESNSQVSLRSQGLGLLAIPFAYPSKDWCRLAGLNGDLPVFKRMYRPLYEVGAHSNGPPGIRTPKALAGPHPLLRRCRVPVSEEGHATGVEVSKGECGYPGALVAGRGVEPRSPGL